MGNGALDGLEFTQALAAGAEKLGATIVAGSAVGFRLGNGKVESVVTSDGEIACGGGPHCGWSVVPGCRAMAGHRHSRGSAEGADHQSAAGRPGLGL